MSDEIVIHGRCPEAFAPVMEVFRAAFLADEELGARFSATLDGELVLDLWAGWADRARTRPFEARTLTPVFSTTKAVAALMVARLVDQGRLSYEQTVADIWPAFGAAGKDRVTVAQALSHQAGVPGFLEPIDPETWFHWDALCARLAALTPLWPPGTASGYHAITFGYIAGEIFRLVDGRTLGTALREDLARPLDLDLWIGLPESEDHRVADLIPPPPGGAIGDGEQSDLTRNMSSHPGIDPLDTRTREWRAAEIPAAGGTGNARSVAQIHTILANGGVAKGKRFMSEAGCRKALEVQVEGTDKIMGIPAKFGLGFGLPGAMVPLPNPNSMFWGGYGGSLIIIDMDARATFGFVMNKMVPTTTGDMRALGLAMTMWQALSA